MLIPINITGPSFSHRSRSLSSQRTVGLYPEVIDAPAKSKFILNSWPGLKSFGTSTGINRGLFEHKEVLYKVCGETLYSVDANGNHTSLGTVEGTDTCDFAGIGSHVVIVSEGRPWLYNGSTVAEITDSDLETPNGVAHLNNQVIFDGDGGRFVTSDVGDATTIQGLNYATAESNADDIVRPYVFNQVLYLMGEKTIESWWDSGVGNPPFDRIEGGIFPIGLGALHSTAHNDNYLYLFGDDNRVYRITGSSKENISTIALSNAMDSYQTVSDAIGFCLSFDNQNFYLLIFPAEEKSWGFSESSGQWFELNEGRYIGNYHAYCYRKNIIANHENGDLYELDLETYDENGTNVVRFRDTAPLSGELLGAAGKRVELNRFELIMETGVGRLPSASDNRENPYVMLSLSTDGGKTFGTERWGRLGKMNKYTKIEWHALGSFQEAIIRVKISDPNLISIHSANAELSVGI